MLAFAALPRCLLARLAIAGRHDPTNYMSGIFAVPSYTMQSSALWPATACGTPGVAHQHTAAASDADTAGAFSFNGWGDLEAAPSFALFIHREGSSRHGSWRQSAMQTCLLQSRQGTLASGAASGCPSASLHQLRFMATLLPISKSRPKRSSPSRQLPSEVSGVPVWLGDNTSSDLPPEPKGAREAAAAAAAAEGAATAAEGGTAQADDLAQLSPTIAKARFASFA